MDSTYIKDLKSELVYLKKKYRKCGQCNKRFFQELINQVENDLFCIKSKKLVILRKIKKNVSV